MCALQWPPRVVVTNTKARSNACKEISSQGFKWICLEGLCPLRGVCIRRAVAGTNTEVETPSMWVFQSCSQAR